MYKRTHPLFIYNSIILYSLYDYVAIAFLLLIPISFFTINNSLHSIVGSIDFAVFGVKLPGSIQSRAIHPQNLNDCILIYIYIYIFDKFPLYLYIYFIQSRVPDLIHQDEDISMKICLFQARVLLYIKRVFGLAILTAENFINRIGVISRLRIHGFALECGYNTLIVPSPKSMD